MSHERCYVMIMLYDVVLFYVILYDDYLYKYIYVMKHVIFMSFLDSLERRRKTACYLYPVVRCQKFPTFCIQNKMGPILVGGFKYFLFSLLFGEDFQFD